MKREARFLKQYRKIFGSLTADMAKDERDRSDREAGGDGGCQDGESASGDRGGGRGAGDHQAEEEGGETLDGHRSPELQAARLDRHRRLPLR